jgi:hypothetical protein
LSDVAQRKVRNLFTPCAGVRQDHREPVADRLTLSLCQVSLTLEDGLQVSIGELFMRLRLESTLNQLLTELLIAKGIGRENITLYSLLLLVSLERQPCLITSEVGSIDYGN